MLLASYKLTSFEISKNTDLFLVKTAIIDQLEKITSKSKYVFRSTDTFILIIEIDAIPWLFFFNCDPLHVRLNSHYKV